MSSTQICTRQVQFKFFVPVIELDEFNTPDIRINEVPWKIRVRKVAINARKGRISNRDGRDHMINLFLICNYKGVQTGNWCIEAGATFRLIAHNENSNSIEKAMSVNKFDEGQTTSCLETFISWKELTDENNHFIKDGKITIEALITSSPLCSFTTSSVCEVSSTTFGMVLKDVKSLSSTYSSKVTLRGIEWDVLFRKQANNFLGVYLNMITNTEHLAWSFQVKFKVKLISHCNEVESVEKQFNRRYHLDSYGCGWTNFISFDKLLCKNLRYLEHRNVYFDISIDVGPQEPFWKTEESFLTNSPSAMTFKCPICLESLRDRDVVATGCGHLFCDECIRRTIQQNVQQNRKCPLCNAATDAADLRPIYC